MADPQDPQGIGAAFAGQGEIAPYIPSWSEWLGAKAQDMMAGAPLSYAQGFGQRVQQVAGFVPGLGQALAGNQAYRDYQGGNYVGAALNAAGSLPIPNVAMFAGPLARTADHAALAAAERMAASGAGKQAVIDATGWFTGADGKWRFEIPDNKAQLQPNPAAAAFESRMNGGAGTLGEVFSHPELFAAYPDLASIPVGVAGAGRRASYLPGPPEGINVSGGSTSDMLHELQHAVQTREGFSPGANSGAAGYQNAAGEVEARNVSKRADYYAPFNRMKPPWVTEDTPVGKQTP